MGCRGSEEKESWGMKKPNLALEIGVLEAQVYLHITIIINYFGIERFGAYYCKMQRYRSSDASQK